MTWALLLWSVYIVTWMLVTESRPVFAAAWWLAGIVCVVLLRPTYRISARDAAGAPVRPPDPAP